MSQLVTGEAVALDLRPAALPSRVLAGLLDALLQAVVLLVVSFLAAVASVNASPAAGDALGIVVLVVVLIVYPVTFETLLRGRTPGKAAMGLRVVRDDGGPIGFRQALVRGLTGAFVERPGITVFVGAVVTSLLNPQGKRLGDLLAGTVVARERVVVQGGQVATMPPELAGWAAQLDLSRFDDALALSVRQFVARAGSLTPAAREDLGSRLVTAVAQAVGPPPPAPGWAVLAAVLAERRRREELRVGARPGGPGYAPQGYAPQAPAPQGYAPQAPAPQGYYPQAPAPQGYYPQPRSTPPPPSAPPAGQEPPTTPGGFVVPS